MLVYHQEDATVPVLILAMGEGIRDHRCFVKVRGPESRESQCADSWEWTERCKHHTEGWWVKRQWG